MGPPQRHQIDDKVDADHDPDPSWALDDPGDDDAVDEAGGRRLRLWVIAVAVLIVLALLLQLGWPLAMDLLDREQDTRGFPTPGVI